MKVGIITCHDVYNSGSSLQAYSLSKIISEFCEVEIIDYKPDYLFRLFNFMEVDAVKWQQNAIRRWLYRIYVAPKRLKNIKRYLVYKQFNKRYLPLSKTRYKSLNDLTEGAQYDKYICGSDQIWNSDKYPCGEDPAFFLGFTNAEKIAYAASFGGNTVSERGRENIEKYLPLFTKISVRETSGIDILRKSGIHAEQVLDPVFFLSGDDWRAIAHKPTNIPETYVLVYGYDNSDEFRDLINEYKNQNLLYIGEEKLRNIGPLEFIWLIDHAETVLTTSFHAVSFSIILHTQFVSSLTGNPELYERLESVMKLCGLEERRYSILKKQDNWKQKKIDYRSVDLKLEVPKIKSKDFLFSALGVSYD